MAAATSEPEGPLPVTVVLPVLNEERNLAAALETVVGWAEEIVVVDSHSTDRTAEIATAHGARVVQFDYPGHGPRKRAWLFANLEFRHEWVFMLDADERVPSALREEISEAIKRTDVDGFYVDREFVFMGRSLRCFRPNWNLRLIRPQLAGMEDFGLHGLSETGDNEIHEHVVIRGRTAHLRQTLIHHDYRSITDWLDRHNGYCTWEAHLTRRLRGEPIGVGLIGFLRLDTNGRKHALRRLWVRLPGRPLLRFLVWYFGRRGFLDGWPGLVFCLLMAHHELTIAIKVRELEAGLPG
ncbi:MAG TPA: glycosyltransferase family 2 protein [Solirubrobacteraceae bacterium]|nr:glycosyltransferase family 2 protein [Solirubrobacteraceae bacterium]